MIKILYTPLNPQAIWCGPPTQATCKWILENTLVDPQTGRRYYIKEDGRMAALKTPEQFADLNRLLDKNRVSE